MPGKPAADAVVNSEEALQLKRQLNDNRRKVLTLLRGVTDKASAEAPDGTAQAAGRGHCDPRRKRLICSTRVRSRAVERVHAQLRETTAAINTEEQRLRGVPGVALPSWPGARYDRRDVRQVGTAQPRPRAERSTAGHDARREDHPCPGGPRLGHDFRAAQHDRAIAKSWVSSCGGANRKLPRRSRAC